MRHPFVATPNNGTCSSCGKLRSDNAHWPWNKIKKRSNKRTRSERILEHGYEAYAREEGHYDTGGDE